jgi:hypothetical protein
VARRRRRTSLCNKAALYQEYTWLVKCLVFEPRTQVLTSMPRLPHVQQRIGAVERICGTGAERVQAHAAVSGLQPLHDQKLRHLPIKTAVRKRAGRMRKLDTSSGISHRILPLGARNDDDFVRSLMAVLRFLLPWWKPLHYSPQRMSNNRLRLRERKAHASQSTSPNFSAESGLAASVMQLTDETGPPVQYRQDVVSGV